MRMLHLFVGQNNFLDSIRLFLNRYAYRTATAIDFWACVEEITSLPISKNNKFTFLRIQFNSFSFCFYFK